MAGRQKLGLGKMKRMEDPAVMSKHCGLGMSKVSVISIKTPVFFFFYVLYVTLG